MEGEKRLAQLIDIDKIQHLQDTFAAVANITTVIINPDGTPVTRPSNLYGFCAKMQAHPKGVKKCLLTNAGLIEANLKTRQPAVMLCPHSGLATASVPIFLGDELLGSWIIGQARMGGPDDTVLRKTATDLAIPFDELSDAMASLPTTSQQEFARVFDFLIALSQTVIEMSQASQQLAGQNAELKDITQQYESTALMLRKFIDSSDVGMYVTDYHTGEVLMVNQRYADNFGIDPKDAVGKKCWDVGGPGGGTFCPYCPRDRLLNEDGSPAAPYIWENQNPLTGAWLRCTNQALAWVDGRLAHMVTYLDITSEHNLRDTLARLAFYDSGMQLPNHLKLRQDIESAPSLESAWLVCFDIRMLRRINDAYGREIGDLLMETAARWVDELPCGIHTLYRVEGDEFCLFFPDCTLDNVNKSAAAIAERFGEPWHLKLEDQEVNVLSGVTVAIVRLEKKLLSENILTILERTLDAARHSGEVAVYDEEMARAARAHTKLELSLRSCVKNGMQGFDVHFQPIVDPACGTWKGMEALCRWNDPETGPVPPIVFIKEAEQLGLIGKMGIWVLERAIANCKKWKLDEVDGFFLSVNLSPNQVLDDGLVDQVTGLLKQYDYPGSKLFLEVTESTEFTFSSQSMSVIDNLRFRGVRFSLDDFGTGYSSFNNLKNLPVSMLKTEREFIWGIEEDNYMQYFFYTMAELAHAADMKMLAEGVETRQQLEIVLRNGVDYLQGYYFSKPLPAAEMEKKLAAYHQVDPSFYTLHTGEIKAEHLFRGKDAYMASPRLFMVLNQCMQLLLTEPDLDTAIDQVLATVGKHFDVSRAYVFLKLSDTGYSNTHEWCAPGVRPEKDRLANIPEARIRDGWIDPLLKSGVIVASDISVLPKEISIWLAAQDVKAVAVLPMLDEGSLVGFVGFDDTKHREWLPEEIVMLRNLCMTMASALKKQNLQLQLFERGIRLSKVLDHVGVSILATDAVTGETLWTSGAAAAPPPQGTPPKGRRHVENDRLVPWEGGRLVRLRCSMELADGEDAPNQGGPVKMPPV